MSLNLFDLPSVFVQARSVAVAHFRWPRVSCLITRTWPVRFCWLSPKTAQSINVSCPGNHLEQHIKTWQATTLSYGLWIRALVAVVNKGDHQVDVVVMESWPRKSGEDRDWVSSQFPCYFPVTNFLWVRRLRVDLTLFVVGGWGEGGGGRCSQHLHLIFHAIEKAPSCFLLCSMIV